jgi:type IV secretion system protein VirB10
MTDRENPATVEGERTNATLGAGVSLQSRISNVLAVGLMSLLGLGLLTWYYAHALARPARAHQEAQAASAKRAEGDLPLPSLGKIEAPMVRMPDSLPRAGATSAMAMPVDLPEVALQPTPASGAPPVKSPEELTLERRLSGQVFASQGSGPNAAALTATADGRAYGAPLGESGALSASGAGELGPWLRPTLTTAVHAEILPTQRLLLPKGAFLDCTLETAIDSTLPGMTTCVMATDTFGVDGQVVLLERGTKLVGETRGQVQQGAARVFVLWSEARTPTGVIVPLASPGADELGRSGLPGSVDHHFWERFGAALLVSIIDGGIQSAVQSSRSGSGTVIVNPSATQDVMTDVLKGTINIAPTVIKQQGDRIQVLVARDLDFRSVYELKSR